MSLIIRKVGDNLYDAEATPPHVRVAWSTATPLPIPPLIEELQSRGCHQRDIGDALYEQDPNWLESLR